MKNIGIKDVARRANTSVATVSRVLNKRGYISDEMYKKVYSAMDELDYHPNQIARSLFLHRTYYVGLIIPDVSHPFFSQLTKEIELAFNSRGYKLMLCDTIGETDREREYLGMLRENKVDGIIIGSHLLETDDYLKANLPIVSIDMDFGPEIINISSNHEKGGEIAAKTLIENGCKNVVQIMGNRKVKTTSHRRHEVFQHVMEENNCNCITLELESREFSTDAYRNIANRLFCSEVKIDGVFAVDTIAARVIQAAHERGINIPGELKIIGYDGTDIADLTYPKLTTIQQSYRDISNSIVETLCAIIDGESPNARNVYHDVTLIKGGTTL